MTYHISDCFLLNLFTNIVCCISIFTLGPFILPNGTQLTDSELLNTNRNDALNNTYNQERMFRYGENCKLLLFYIIVC